MTIYHISVNIIISSLQDFSMSIDRENFSNPSQPMLSFNIVPYGTISGMQGILPLT